MPVCSFGTVKGDTWWKSSSPKSKTQWQWSANRSNLRPKKDYLEFFSCSLMKIYSPRSIIFWRLSFFFDSFFLTGSSTSAGFGTTDSFSLKNISIWHGLDLYAMKKGGKEICFLQQFVLDWKYSSWRRRRKTYDWYDHELCRYVFWSLELGWLASDR